MSKAMMGRRGFVVAAACTLALALTGCAGGGAQSDSPNGSQSDEKVLNAGSTSYFYAESMDPSNSWDGWEMQYYGITENLLKLDEDFNVEPWLAKSVEQIDDLTWKFELRDDVTFTNGEKMTGDAVKACLERTYEPFPAGYGCLAGNAAVDLRSECRRPTKHLVHHVR